MKMYKKSVWKRKGVTIDEGYKIRLRRQQQETVVLREQKFSTIDLDSSIYPQIKKVGTIDFISNVWFEVLNSIGFSSDVEGKRADSLTQASI